MDKNHFRKGGINLNLSCDIILDLIPLVKDGVASKDSTIIVNEHIKYCDSCRAEFKTFETIKAEQTVMKDQKIIFAIKRGIFITQLIILIAGAIIGVALSNSMGMFYNFLIMPIIGGIGFITFKKKWYIAPLAILVIIYLWQIIEGFVLGGFEWFAFYGGLYYSVIYAVLGLLGAIITALLQFAFRKER